MKNKIEITLAPWFKKLLSRKKEIDSVIEEHENKMNSLRQESIYLNLWIASHLVNINPSVQELNADALAWDIIGGTKISVEKVDLAQVKRERGEKDNPLHLDINILQKLEVPEHIIQKFIELKEDSYGDDDIEYLEDNDDFNR